MGRDAQRDGRQAGGDERRDAAHLRAAAPPGSAGPANAASAKRPRLLVERTDPLGRCQVRDMDDQRVEARPPLGLRRCGRRLRHWWRRRRGRRPSRSGPRPARRPGSAARLRRWPHRRTAGRGWLCAWPARYSARPLSKGAAMSFKCPVSDQRLVLDHVVRIGELGNGPDATWSTRCSRAPRRWPRASSRRWMRIGDTVGARWDDGGVTMPAGLQGSLARIRRGRLDGPVGARKRGRAGAAARRCRRR